MASQERCYSDSCACSSMAMLPKREFDKNTRQQAIEAASSPIDQTDVSNMLVW